MNKAELIRTMVKKAGEKSEVALTAKQMNAALSALMESVTDALKSGEKVVLPGFGMFAVKTRHARQGRNLITGEEVTFPERKLPAFKAGKTLKDAVAAEYRQDRHRRGSVPFSGAAAPFWDYAKV